MHTISGNTHNLRYSHQHTSDVKQLAYSMSSSKYSCDPHHRFEDRTSGLTTVFSPHSLSPIYIYFYFYLVLCLCFSILYFYSSTLNTFTNVNWPPATTLVETSCCSSLKWRNEPTMRWFMTGWDFKSLFLQLSKIAHIDRSTIALAFFLLLLLLVVGVGVFLESRCDMENSVCLFCFSHLCFGNQCLIKFNFSKICPSMA